MALSGAPFSSALEVEQDEQDEQDEPQCVLLALVIFKSYLLSLLLSFHCSCVLPKPFRALFDPLFRGHPSVFLGSSSLSKGVVYIALQSLIATITCALW